MVSLPRETGGWETRLSLGLGASALFSNETKDARAIDFFDTRGSPSIREESSELRSGDCRGSEPVFANDGPMPCCGFVNFAYKAGLGLRPEPSQTLLPDSV